MTKTEIYLEASRRLAEYEEDYSCIAIGMLNPNWCLIWTKEDPLVKAYCAVFNPDRPYEVFDGYVNDDKDPRNLRVMMTSLMAVCWQDFQ